MPSLVPTYENKRIVMHQIVSEFRYIDKKVDDLTGVEFPITKLTLYLDTSDDLMDIYSVSRLQGLHLKLLADGTDTYATTYIDQNNGCIIFDDINIETASEIRIAGFITCWTYYEISNPVLKVGDQSYTFTQTDDYIFYLDIDSLSGQGVLEYTVTNMSNTDDTKTITKVIDLDKIGNDNVLILTDIDINPTY